MSKPITVFSLVSYVRKVKLVGLDELRLGLLSRFLGWLIKFRLDRLSSYG